MSTFGLDGAAYEIDLTEVNATKPRTGLEEFVAHARRTGGRLKRGTATKWRIGDHEGAWPAAVPDGCVVVRLRRQLTPLGPSLTNPPPSTAC